MRFLSPISTSSLLAAVLLTALPAVAQEPQQDEAMQENLAQVRRRGLARAEGDFMEGMSAFAAPVFSDRGRLVAVLTILGYRGGFDSRWTSPLAIDVKRCR